MKRIILLTILSFFISCGDTNTKQKNSDNKSPMEGFWNRIGTIQLVNGIPVDTILVKNSDNKDYKQIKVFKDANSVKKPRQTRRVNPNSAGRSLPKNKPGRYTVGVNKKKPRDNSSRFDD